MRRKKLKSAWLEYFNFSARERKGALFLAVLLIVQVGIIFVLRNKKRTLNPPDQNILMALVREAESADRFVMSEKSETNELSLYPFNPNEIIDTAFHYPYLTEKQVSVIRNYLRKGGKFKTRNDFKKMYCISEREFERLSPYLTLPDSQPAYKKENRNFHKQAITVDLSNADSVGLLGLPGIGPVFASRIVRYRERLGGFVLVNQLKEVWGMNDTIYQRILPHIFLKDALPIRYVYLNTDSFSVLASHPYIKGKIAGLIGNYRRQHPFREIDELKSLPLITEENFRKLVPYLKLE